VLDIVVRRRNALPPQAAWALFAGLATVSLMIGLGFLWMGAWPVLPFAGLEVAGVGACWWILARRRDDHERLLVEGDRLRILKHRRGRVQVEEFQRQWARVELEAGAHRWYPTRLWVGSHGRRVELARGTDDATRRRIARELDRWLGAGYR